MTDRTYKEYGIIDAAGQAFLIKGYFRGSDDPPHVAFILPREVVERANVIYCITDDELVKSRWASVTSEDALMIFRGLFRAMMVSTSELKAYYDGTPYGSRTHRSI